MLGGGRKETLKGTLCCPACLSPQPLPRSVLLLPEEEMSFHSRSGLCCYLFPSSGPNSPMNFSERPQLVCQGPGTNIKTTKGGKKIPEPLGCRFYKMFFCSSLHVQGYSSFVFSCPLWAFSSAASFFPPSMLLPKALATCL